MKRGVTFITTAMLLVGIGGAVNLIEPPPAKACTLLVVPDGVGSSDDGAIPTRNGCSGGGGKGVLFGGDCIGPVDIDCP